MGAAMTRANRQRTCVTNVRDASSDYENAPKNW